MENKNGLADLDIKIELFGRRWFGSEYTQTLSITFILNNYGHLVNANNVSPWYSACAAKTQMYVYYTC